MLEPACLDKWRTAGRPVSHESNGYSAFCHMVRYVVDGESYICGARELLRNRMTGETALIGACHQDQALAAQAAAINTGEPLLVAEPVPAEVGSL